MTPFRLAVVGVLALLTVAILLDATVVSAPVGGGTGGFPLTRRLFSALRSGSDGGGERLRQFLETVSPWRRAANVTERALVPASLDELPILDDCLGERDGLPGDGGEETAGAVRWRASVLRSLPLRPGFTVGRKRGEILLLPGGLTCASWWEAGVRNEATGEMLRGVRMAEAFVLEPRDLPRIGRLLHGDPIGRGRFEAPHDEARKLPVCSGDSLRQVRVPCSRFPPRRLPDVSDGELTVSLVGTVILHRFTSDPSSPDRELDYRRLYVRNGSLEILTRRIYDVETGVLF